MRANKINTQIGPGVIAMLGLTPLPPGSRELWAATTTSDIEKGVEIE
ncbi:MAG: hypothetical protein KAU14_08840 [Thermoplasmata archaeon]|nr:hypothetical protein [Thermoplasmata archaeon]